VSWIVHDEAALSAETAALLYEMRWGVEVFYRSCKQTLQRRKMLSHTPEPAQWELTWTILGMWLLGVMSVEAILARGGKASGSVSRLSRTALRRRTRSSPRRASSRCGR